jgi:hypothetical protein
MLVFFHGLFFQVHVGILCRLFCIHSDALQCLVATHSQLLEPMLLLTCPLPADA